MKKNRKIIGLIMAALFVSLGVFATPLYYTIFHAVEEDTTAVVRSGGSGSIRVSQDGGENYTTIADLHFDEHGRAVAKTYKLNKYPEHWPLKLQASFNESDSGKPLDTVIDATIGEFLESVSRYNRWPWLGYYPVFVTYQNLPDIVDTAIGARSFDLLVKAVQTAGLEETLRGKGPFTVFAPTDDAFMALATALELTPEELLALPNLADILLYHVVAGALDGDAVAAETMIETVLGKDVEVALEGDVLKINGASIIAANVKASNGIIHVIDAVLLPPTLPTVYAIARDTEGFSILKAALEETGLDAALSGEGPFTVFAPTDEAFAALGIPPADLLADPELGDILLYHVVEGRLKAENVIAVDRLKTLLGEDVKVNVTTDGVFINDSKIVATDIKAENGIVHVIDAVLIPEEMPDIVDTAIAAGQFNALAEALVATGLDEVLRGDGPFTVFAPTDEAFEKLPKWLIRFLFNNPKYLEKVLLYHVVPGDLNSEEVASERKLETALGKKVRVKSYPGHLYINRSKVIAADIEAENGRIHVINNVLIPWHH